MPTYQENLTTARDNFATKLAEVSASPKPTYNIDGQSVSWTEYYKFLSEQIQSLNKQINEAEPFEEISQGIT